MSFEFVDELPPPVPGRGRTNPILFEFAEALRANPDRWAKYLIELSRGTKASTSSKINRNGANCPKPFQGGGFESRIRDGVIYVRYTGVSA